MGYDAAVLGANGGVIWKGAANGIDNTPFIPFSNVNPFPKPERTFDKDTIDVIITTLGPLVCMTENSGPINLRRGKET